MRLSRQQAGGVTVIDDSYNANPTSMAAAITTLKRRTNVTIAGDLLDAARELAKRAREGALDPAEIEANRNDWTAPLMSIAARSIASDS